MSKEQWPLNFLISTCQPVAAVWLALLEFANERGKASITPGRIDIARCAGVSSMRTVSNALTALENGGWIKRKKIYFAPGKSGLYITLLRPWRFHPLKKKREWTPAYQRRKKSSPSAPQMPKVQSQPGDQQEPAKPAGYEI